MSAATATMPKKKNPPSDPGRQIGIRFPNDLLGRLEHTGEMLGLDMSNLIRLIIIEKLPEYEGRGKRARGIDDPTD